MYLTQFANSPTALLACSGQEAPHESICNPASGDRRTRWQILPHSLKVPVLGQAHLGGSERQMLMRGQSTDEGNDSTSIRPSSLVVESATCHNKDVEQKALTTIVRRCWKPAALPTCSVKSSSQQPLLQHVQQAEGLFDGRGVPA